MSNPTNSPTPHGRPAISPAGSAMLAAYAMLPLIASATVALRILANEVKRKRLGADDYTIVGSLVLAASLSMMSIYAILEGLHGSPVGGIKSVGDLIRRNEVSCWCVFLLTGRIIANGSECVVAHVRGAVNLPLGDRSGQGLVRDFL